MLVEKDIKDIYVWVDIEEPKALCFAANTAGSTVILNATGTPTSVSLETSTDYGGTWADYTIGNTITLTNVGDKVWIRNKSNTDTRLNIDGSNRYYFEMTGSIAGSGDITYLLNKNGTKTLSEHCFNSIFSYCSSLTTAPSLPATTLADSCCRAMFYYCTNMTTAPELPATTLASSCYYSMFSSCRALATPPILSATTLASSCYYSMFRACTSLTTLPSLPANILRQSCYGYMFCECSKIRLSKTKSGEYQTEYRIPTTGTGTEGSSWNDHMFYSTGGTFTSNPSINTTYYTSNTVV